MFIRHLCCVLAVLMLLVNTASAAPILQQQILGAEALLYCVESGQTLYEKNADIPVPPASVTKLMTALIVLEQIDDLSQTTTVSDTAVQIERDSTHIALVPGEIVTLQDMLYATLMQSANDAANVLAEAVSGSQKAFAYLMNVRAAELGCTGSHFENAHGLDGPTHRITAHDLARITAALLEQPRFLEVAGAQSYTMPATNKQPAPRTFYTKQYMLRKNSEFYYPYAIAGKNGYTSKAHHTQSTIAHKDGMTLIAVSLGSTGKYNAWHDMRTLFDYGFHSFQTVTLTGTQIAQLAAKIGADVCADDCRPVTISLPIDADIGALSLSHTIDASGLRAFELTHGSITQTLSIMPYPLSCDIDAPPPETEKEEKNPSITQNLFFISFTAASMLAAWFVTSCVVQKRPAYYHLRRLHRRQHTRRKSQKKS